MAIQKINSLLIGSGHIKDNISTSRIYANTSIPSPSLGKDGDLYIRIDGLNSDLYFKVGNRWRSIIKGVEKEGTGLQPASGFNELIFDTFETDATDTNSTIDNVRTIAEYNSAYQLYRLQCDKSKTITASGVNFTLSSAPSFTLQVHDIIYISSLDEWRRITSLSSQTQGTVDVAFSNDVNNVSCMLSQAVYTKDLINLGNAAEKERIRDTYPNQNIQIIHVDYDDSLVANDEIPNSTDEALIVASGSNEGLQSDITFPNSDTFAPLFIRPAAPEIIPNYPLKNNTNKQRCFVVFFCNPNNNNVTSGANLLKFEISLIENELLQNGGWLNSAYARSDNSVIPLNSLQPVTVDGKTEWTLTFHFMPSINPGTTQGDIEVQVDGHVIPRYVEGVTVGAWFQEVSTNKLRFWTDLEPLAVSLRALRRQGILNGINKLDIEEITNNTYFTLTTPITTINSDNILLSGTGPVEIKSSDSIKIFQANTNKYTALKCEAVTGVTNVDNALSIIPDNNLSAIRIGDVILSSDVVLSSDIPPTRIRISRAIDGDLSDSGITFVKGRDYDYPFIWASALSKSLYIDTVGNADINIRNVGSGANIYLLTDGNVRVANYSTGNSANLIVQGGGVITGKDISRYRMCWAIVNVVADTSGITYASLYYGNGITAVTYSAGSITLDFAELFYSTDYCSSVTPTSSAASIIWAIGSRGRSFLVIQPHNLATVDGSIFVMCLGIL